MWYVVPLILSIVLASMVFVDENEKTEELKMAQKVIAGLLISFTVVGFVMYHNADDRVWRISNGMRTKNLY
jgi:predicted membrane protein